MTPKFFVIARVVGRDGAIDLWRDRLVELCKVSATEPYGDSYYWGQDVDGEPDTLWGLEGYTHPIGFFIDHVSSDIFKREMALVDKDKLLRTAQGLDSPDYDLHHYDEYGGFLKRTDDVERDSLQSFVVVKHYWAKNENLRNEMLDSLAQCADRLASGSPQVQSALVLKECRDTSMATLWLRFASEEDWNLWERSDRVQELVNIVEANCNSELKPKLRTNFGGPKTKKEMIGRRDPRMPPGPPTVPVLGNMHMIPTTGLGKKFMEWSLQYGKIFSLKIGSGNIIVICDRKAVHELLDKKGSIYSDRPPNIVPLFITRGDHMTMECQSPSWREKRTVVTRNLNPKSLDEKHFRVQETEAVILMNRLLDDPGNFYSYSRLYASSVAAILAWGFRATTLDSFWYKDVSAMIEKWLEAIEPGATPPVDLIPWLWYIPGKWKSRVYKMRDHMDKVWSQARAMVDDRRARGDRRECMIDMKLDEYEKNGWPMSQHAFNNLFGELMEAGADTTANQILTLILALAKYPKFQEKARVEIDAVCGTERAPVFSDFAKMPYVNAIVKEGLRWRPTSDLGLPHTVTKDDYYDGMLIPKGSTIFVGVWAMHHDKDYYGSHDTFDPDRYLSHTKLANEYAVGPDYEKRDKSILSNTRETD
ncbi:oxidoreductase [Fusarium coicis]|nr:oxidoreductase [Fusarium coicis]